MCNGEIIIFFVDKYIYNWFIQMLQSAQGILEGLINAPFGNTGLTALDCAVIKDKEISFQQLRMRRAKFGLDPEHLLHVSRDFFLSLANFLSPYTH